jgi:hypothetical protein
MTELDFVLLTVYFLGVSYVLYQIVNSFNDELTIRLDEDDFKETLKSMNLAEAVNITFRFNNRYEFDKLTGLAIRVENKSKQHPVYIDWDECALSDLDGRSRRVARTPPGGSLDAFQSQVFSVIAPGKTLRENISGEDQLTRKGENGLLEVTKTLVDFTKPNPKSSTPAQRQRYQDFMASRINLEVYLEIALRFVGNNTAVTGDRTRVVCKFIITKLDWTAGLPWNPRQS